MTHPVKVLHVEVGGSYGGSLRALEVYLHESDRTRIEHHALLYYPAPGAERLAPFISSIETLYDVVPDRLRVAWDSTRAAARRRWSSYLPAGVRTLSGFGSQLRVLRRLTQRLREGRYDVVHANNTFTYQAPTLIAARWLRVPLIAHVRNPIELGLLSRSLMRLTSTVVTVNHAFEVQLAGWGLPVRVCTCHDGLETPAADSGASRALRRALLDSGSVLVGSAGRLDDQKGYQDLIRAARRVVDAWPSVRFAVIGDGPLRQDLERMIQELQLQDHFHLCGFRPDVANFIAALDLFVSSSHWEGLPLAVLEALLLEKPVIATRVGGTPEIVIPGKTGQLVPVRNPEALASAMISFLESPKQAAALTEEARRFAAAWCDPAASARRMDQLIEDTARSL